MAVSFITTIGTTDYGFDWVNEIIEVEAAVADSSAADLKEAIHDAQDGTEGMPFDRIASFGNPVVLTGTSSTFLNVILLAGWKILSLSGSGTFTVGDGNVVHITDGIDIFSPNVNVTYVNNTSAAGVLVTGGGSALTAAQATQLLELYKLQGLLVGSPMNVTPTSRSVAGEGIDMVITGDGINTSTVTRQP